MVNLPNAEQTVDSAYSPPGSHNKTTKMVSDTFIVPHWRRDPVRWDESQSGTRQRGLVLVVSEECAGLRGPLSRSGPRRGDVAQGRMEESMF
jgi:hypothetical protein